MVTYSTNWMGPLNLEWIKENGDCWSGGRIDIYGVPGEPYPLEYSLPVMHSKDWNRLSNWLDTVETPVLWSREDLLSNFERFIGREIRWWG